MTDGGVFAMIDILWQRLRTLQGFIAAMVFCALIIGLFLGSTVGRILCGVGALALVGYVFYAWKRDGVFSEVRFQRGRQHGESAQEESYPQPSERDMKKLLFDDFQAPSSSYVVKEVNEEEKVIPSTKSGHAIAVSKEEKVKEFDIADFFDLESDMYRHETDPRSEFNFLLTKLLLGMKEVLFAHTVAFFWANREKQQLVLEAKATQSAQFVAEKRFAIDQDVASQVARTGKPQVLGRISSLAEKEVLRHYQTEEGIRSLIVVPVFYLTGREEQHLPEGVIVADSKAEDAFGAETLALLGHFTKMISALIKSYTNKYDLLLDSELLSSIRRMQDRVKSDRTEQGVLNALADEAMKLLNWDVLTVVMYSDDLRTWALQKVVNRSLAQYPAVNDPVAFENSIVGRTIQSNTIVHVNDVLTEPEIRFSAGEQIAMQGSFLSVPISSLNRCYGALTLESERKFHWTPNEVEVVYRLIENAAGLLEVLYMNDVVKDHVAADQLSGALNKKHFDAKLREEFRRAEDFLNELSLVSIAIDNVQEHIQRYGRDGLESIMGQVVKLLRINTQPYDVIGRQDASTVLVLLMNTTANNAYVWAEKVRKHIASNVIELGRLHCSVTVSAGVSGLTDGMNPDDLVSASAQVLTKAIESGGNLVRFY